MGRTRKPQMIRQTPDRPMTEDEERLAAEALAYAASDADYEQYAEVEEVEDFGPPPSVAEAIEALEACGDPAEAEAATAAGRRRHLAVPVPLIEDQARLWRQQATLEERIALARGLWDSDIHEARIAAAKLLIQARIRPDEAVWGVICDWIGTLDDRVLCDQAVAAGARRLSADPKRIDTVEGWISAPNPWTRRAALLVTLPFTRTMQPGPEEAAIRSRVLGWCATLAPERDLFVQKAIGQWLGDLSKRDPAAVTGWLAAHGAALKPVTRREASRRLG